MSNYCEKADLERLGNPKLITRWADDDGDGVLDSDEELNITACCAWAYNRINRKLAQRYAVPFTTVPDAIKDIAIILAIYRLAWRFNRAEAANLREEFDDAEKALADLADGDEDLPGVADLAAGYGNAIESTTEDAEPEFSVTRFDKASGVALDGDQFDGTLDRF